ncbi:MAG: transporter substrate-binding domain-containing protein [Acidimicrobiales bacterium]|nr:transporter substrate-binding domain-containing protein [Acidimicrobiales bacterium]
MPGTVPTDIGEIMSHSYKTRTIAAALLATSLAFGTVACSKSDDDSAAKITKLADLEGKTIGVQTGTTGETYTKEHLPKGATVKSFKDTTGLFAALDSGDISAILQDLPVNAGRAAEVDNVHVVETFKTGEQYGFAVEKGSELQGELNTALKKVRDNGTYDKIYEKYFPKAGAEAGPGPAASDVEGTRTLKVCSDIPYAPMEMEGKGPRGLDYTGFDIDLLDAMAATMDAKLSIKDVGFDGILGNLASGNCDVVASSVTITPERAKEVDFTDPYFDADQSLLVKK